MLSFIAAGQEALPSKLSYKLANAPIEDSDQPVHPHSLIRVFDGYSMASQKSNVSSGRKLRLIRLQMGRQMLNAHT